MCIRDSPNIRGGGEYGREWHNSGTQTNKQNVFDDFIAAAEYLIDNNYTSSDFLALRGGSNGGLLVGAVMTQRPELMKVALPAVGVLDMLRYHKFTSGAGWAYDYGTSDQSVEMFEYLKSYSPVHNVRENILYPATLITTGDHDDRVVPAHSFKFAAELQQKGIKENPLLIRIETNAGHGAGTPVSKTIEQYADIYGFTLFNMGFDKLPNKFNWMKKHKSLIIWSIVILILVFFNWYSWNEYKKSLKKVEAAVEQYRKSIDSIAKTEQKDSTLINDY